MSPCAPMSLVHGGGGGCGVGRASRPSLTKGTMGRQRRRQRRRRRGRGRGMINLIKTFSSSLPPSPPRFVIAVGGSIDRIRRDGMAPPGLNGATARTAMIELLSFVSVCRVVRIPFGNVIQHSSYRQFSPPLIFDRMREPSSTNFALSA